MSDIIDKAGDFGKSGTSERMSGIETPFTILASWVLMPFVASLILSFACVSVLCCEGVSVAGSCLESFCHSPTDSPLLYFGSSRFSETSLLLLSSAISLHLSQYFQVFGTYYMILVV